MIMRIKKISVYGLFGLFDHVVPLFTEDRITIIHAPNGYGKTTILKLIYSLCKGHDIDILMTDFKRFRLDFEDGSNIQVEKIKNDYPQKKSGGLLKDLNFKEILKYTYTKADGEVLEYIPRFNREKLRSFISQLISPKANNGDAAFKDPDAIKDLELDEVVNVYSNMFSNLISGSDDQPEWLAGMRDCIDIIFIESSRLYNAPGNYSARDKTNGPEPIVNVYSEGIMDVMAAKISLYADVSHRLDRAFPARLSKNMEMLIKNELKDGDILDTASINCELKELEVRRSRLIEAGLLENGESDHVDISEGMQDNARIVLTMYVRDMKEKLSVFDDLEKKIELLKKIINKQFLYKKMVVSKEKGFIFTLPDGSYLKPDRLSSGEQNELILNYDLLFNSSPGSFILIDEPEISLHIMWQQQFIRDLKEISGLADIDILIATHSPHIIDDFWDLTAELKGAPDVRV
ncbi:excinuclease [Methanocella sp. CWC-04]|uniref:Excinuclease n=1 Tax=Methanooceanicella nereidis TaxID=2052831 RepID=A0AAP2RAG4_9EURY|nr:AAA family ATPase [Methanocella sp. CWC-04]MCD1293559.1 excinuclease [Methanocella sp. CWC-04]